MIRSILPCKRRGIPVAYKFKRWERRNARHEARHNLLSCDYEGYTDKDLFVKPCQNQQVQDRRISDKVNPFIRWANRLTLKMNKEQSLDYVRALLPYGTIGDHAFSHWEGYVKRYR